MKLEKDVGIGLIILSKIQTKTSQSGHWIGIIRVKEQKEDYLQPRGESGKKTWPEMEGHRQKWRNWPRIGKHGKGLLVAYTVREAIMMMKHILTCHYSIL